MDYFAEYGISTPATVNVNFSAIAAGGLGVYFQRNFYDPIIAVLKANGRFVPGVRIGALVGDEFWYSLITHPDVRARWEAIEQAKVVALAMNPLLNLPKIGSASCRERGCRYV